MVLGLTSIIIPCFNHADFLDEAIQSAMRQTYPLLEIIVVNDGSTDNSREVAEKYSFITVLNTENNGLSAARNIGIEASEGEYILTLDADDTIDPEFVTKTIGKNDIVSTAIRYFGDINCIKHPVKPHPTHEDFYKHNHINCCSLYKREIWDKIGGYDEQMRRGLEDWDFWLRATKADFKVTVLKEALFNYRKHGVSMITEAKRHYRETEKYIKSKHI